MPDRAAHEQRALDNEEFANVRLDARLTDVERAWIATAYFYAALHWVEAYLAARQPPEHSRSHTTRKQTISQDPKLSAIQPLYRDLEDASRDARDELRVFTEAEVRALATTKLEPLRTYIRVLLP